MDLIAFMNIVAIKSVLTINKDVVYKNKIWVIGAISSLLLGGLILIFLLVLQNNIFIAELEMPFLYLFLSKGKIFSIVFASGVVLAMSSTCLACLISLKNRVIDKTDDNRFSTLVVFLISMIFSFIPFKIFISIFYPIMGVCNLIFFVFEIKQNILVFKVKQ